MSYQRSQWSSKLIIGAALIGAGVLADRYFLASTSPQAGFFGRSEISLIKETREERNERWKEQNDAQARDRRKTAAISRQRNIDERDAIITSFEGQFKPIEASEIDGIISTIVSASRRGDLYGGDQPANAGPLTVCGGGNSPDGSYQYLLSYIDNHGIMVFKLDERILYEQVSLRGKDRQAIIIRESFDFSGSTGKLFFSPYNPDAAQKGPEIIAKIEGCHGSLTARHTFPGAPSCADGSTGA